MKKTLLSISLLSFSTLGISGPLSDTEPNLSLSSYGVHNSGQWDNQSVIRQGTNDQAMISVVQGKLGQHDGNISVIDAQLDKFGTGNSIKIRQTSERGRSDHKSLVYMDGKSGKAVIDIKQHGLFQQSKVMLVEDADNNTVDVLQRGNSNWSDVYADENSDWNKVTVKQRGMRNESTVTFDNGSYGTGTLKQTVDATQEGIDNKSHVHLINSDLNDIDLRQMGNTNKSHISLSQVSDKNIIDIEQKGNRNYSRVSMIASSNNNVVNSLTNSSSGIDVNQSTADFSVITMNGVSNSAIYVQQN